MDEEYILKIMVPSIVCIYNRDIDIGEVEKIIKELKNNKAPGYDGMAGELIKVLYNTDKDLFMKIFNKIWISSKFPDSWKLTIVTLIPK